MHNMGKGDRKKILGRAKRARKAGRIPLQYGALCFRNTPKGIRILLVTSRRSKRWISPKGWPMPGKTPAETAAEEAWEEAGVRGTPIPHSLGFYRYRKFIDRKTNITCTVQVFPVLVTEQVRRFPEHGERRVKWMKPKTAAKRVSEADLAKIIRRFARDADEGISPRGA